MASDYSLYADLGNTALHVGIYRGGWLADSRYFADELSEEDGWEDALRDALDVPGADLGQCRSAAVCASGPHVTDCLAAIEEVTGIVPHLVGPEDDLGIEYDYDPPESLGRDRILACLAAREYVACPVIVVDAGTFITCDVVDPDGNLLPVGIAPGLRALLLGACTAGPHLADVLLDVVDEGVDCTLPARSTMQSLGNGLRAYLAGTVECLLEMSDECLSPSISAPVVTTGGDGPLVEALLPVVDRDVPLLVLEGLRLTDPARKH